MNISSMATATVFILATAMLSAGMLVCMMAAAYFRIIIQVSAYETEYRFICIPAYAAEQLNSGSCKCCLGSAADTAANQYLNACIRQEGSQCSMTLSIRIDNLGLFDLAIFNIIQFELLCVSKMLKNLSVFICYTNSHLFFSFSLDLIFKGGSVCSFTLLITAKWISAITKAVIPPGDTQYLSVNQAVRKLVTCGFIYFRNGRSGNPHLLSALSMRIFLQINQTDYLIFIYGHRYFFACRYPFRPEAIISRFYTDSSASCRSCHLVSHPFPSYVDNNYSTSCIHMQDAFRDLTLSIREF